MHIDLINLRGDTNRHQYPARSAPSIESASACLPCSFEFNNLVFFLFVVLALSGAKGYFV